MTIYVVTTGCYSDYGISAMFSIKELADAYEQYLTAKGEDSPTVDTWELDSVAPKPLKDMWSYSIRTVDGSRYYKSHICIDADDNSYHRSNAAERICTGISYKSEAHALKLAVEMRQKWLRTADTKAIEDKLCK